MRFVDEALQILRMPMVPPRLLVVAVHALLHDRPFAVVGYEESVQVKIEAVLDGGAVDFSDETACANELGTVEANAFAKQVQFARRLSRVLASAAADVDAEFIRERLQPAFQGANHAGCDAGRVPVHAHNGTERLEPKWMR